VIENCRIAVVTGGGNGIGRALSHRLARDDVKVAVADLDKQAAEAVAAEIDGLAIAADVGRETDIVRIVDRVESDVGPIDLFASNAGVTFGDEAAGAASRSGCIGKVEDRWQLSWQINVMAHVYAARALVPRMIERGGGYFVNTVSAAGLLASIGDAAYTTTKHAALGFAESLAITHGHQGIQVSVVCPQAVQTNMIELAKSANSTDAIWGGADADGIATPEDVANCIVEGVANGKFMILPHPTVTTYFQRKAADHDRWIGGMQRLRAKLART
jgi:NAD(P)-dependent dehydrogenase (short-subunit alcohol dehydrogenase family)